MISDYTIMNPKDYHGMIVLFDYEVIKGWLLNQTTNSRASPRLIAESMMDEHKLFPVAVMNKSLYVLWQADMITIGDVVVQSDYFIGSYTANLATLLDPDKATKTVTVMKSSLSEFQSTLGGNQ